MADFKIVSYVAPTPANEYRELVTQLNDATKENEGIAGEFVVDTDKVGPARRLISTAARELGRTANYVGESADEKGKKTTLVVVLREQRKTGPRKPRGGAESTDETAETAAE